jgi:hypothetical protein
MARMSIDDKFLRDPRVTQLALDLGVSRWEAMGRLLAVFAVCYDLERDIITPAQVDLAGERPGLADALFAVDLAVTTRRGLRIRGVKKRIEYLAPKREAGRQGGLKSGESRRNSAKQKREIREATVNPPDPVPDLVPDPVPEDQSSLPRAIPPEPSPTLVAPPRTVDATLRASPPPAPLLPGSIARANARRRVITTAWQLAGQAFRELGREGIDPTAPDSWAGLPSADSEAMKRLGAIADRLLIGDLPDAEAALAAIRNRVAVAKAEAKAKSPPTRRYLTPMAMWSPISFEHAAALSPEQVRAAVTPATDRRGNPPTPAPQRRVKPEPPPPKGAPVEDLVAMAAAARIALGHDRPPSAAELDTPEPLRLCGDARAGPSDAEPTDPPDEKPTRKNRTA